MHFFLFQTMLLLSFVVIMLFLVLLLLLSLSLLLCYNLADLSTRQSNKTAYGVETWKQNNCRTSTLIPTHMCTLVNLDPNAKQLDTSCGDSVWMCEAWKHMSVKNWCKICQSLLWLRWHKLCQTLFCSSRHNNVHQSCLTTSPDSKLAAPIESSVSHCSKDN